MSKIVRYAIYPPVGVARVGNSVDEYYVAPELPNSIPAKDEKFKDAAGRIKRQAARFRIYGFDANGNAVKEIVVEDGVSITWEAHLANRKAVNYNFENALDLGPFSKAAEKRNKTVVGADRNQLIIDPGSRTISGKNTQGAAHMFDGGYFFSTPVTLGELRTDEAGRLLVLGGTGKSASLDGSPPTTFANNDGWYDDTSDGPIRATVRIGSEEFEAEPAFVAVCPPNYGQGLFGVVTMYDVLYDVYCRHPSWTFPYPKKPNFWEHIFPIFDRLGKSQWVNEGAHFLFGTGSPHDFTSSEYLDQLSNPGAESKATRQELFDWFRDPNEPDAKPVDIPPFYGDGFSEHPSAGIVGLSVTRTQFDWLREWANGNFDTTHSVNHDGFVSVPVEEQPHALTKAHLDDCLGGPFHPGTVSYTHLTLPTKA